MEFRFGSSFSVLVPPSWRVSLRQLMVAQSLTGGSDECGNLWLWGELQWADLDRRYLMWMYWKIGGYIFAWSKECSGAEWSDIDVAEDHEDFGDPHAANVLFRPLYGL
jgi:hypothetical protein